MTIRTRPASPEYRENWDRIYGPQFDPVDDIERDMQLSQLYEVADYELAVNGLVSVSTMARIDELGGDVSRYA